MNIYVAGKMRGLPDFGHQAFRDAAEQLRNDGHTVFNPIEEGEMLFGDQTYKNNPTGDESVAGIDGRVVFLNDLNFICSRADAVALLPNWIDSKGAIAEKAVAEALGLSVIYL
jgi:hypothetical protein